MTSQAYILYPMLLSIYTKVSLKIVFFLFETYLKPFLQKGVGSTHISKTIHLGCLFWPPVDCSTTV